MAASSYARTSFLGGEVSQLYQGRFDKPEYPTFMATCLNGFPIESGAHVRRPGSQHAGFTRGGVKGRNIRFDFNQAVPYQLEFTDGHLRFRSGSQIQFTDFSTITNITTDNPAKVNLTSAVTWVTGDQAQFSGLGSSYTLLQARTFILTKINTTQFTIADGLTGVGIDGSTLSGPLAPGATIGRIIDIATPYLGGSWAGLRLVQGENINIPFGLLLEGAIPPYMLTANSAPIALLGAGFTLAQAVFNDGPYLDPPTNGAQLTPNNKVGVVTFTLSFPLWNTAVSYAKGAFVTRTAVNYTSLIDQNVGIDPATDGGVHWQAISAGAAINNGHGFLQSDIGRLVRFYSEPAAWLVGTTYSAGNVVSYNPTGVPGAETFWQSQVGANTGNIPGIDLIHWSPVTTGAALWSWGKIVSLGNQISGSTGTNIGNMTLGGGLAASFDGVTNKSASASSEFATNGSLTSDGYVGKNYTGSAQKIDHATIYPSTDQGFVQGTPDANFHLSGLLITVNLRAKQTAPASASDGTLLGTQSGGNITAPITIISNDNTTAWNYVWFEIVGSMTQSPGGGGGGG